MPVSIATSPQGVPQIASGVATSTTILTVAFPAGNEVGTLLAVIVSCGATGETITLSDTVNNTYSVALGPVSDAPSSATHQIFYAYSIGGVNSVTVNVSPACTFSVFIAEYFGVAQSGSETSASAAGSGGTPSSGSVTTAASGELILGVCSGTSGAGVGFVSLGNYLNNQGEYQIQSAAGTVAATFAATATAWSASVVTFPPGSGTRNLQTIDDIATWVLVDQLHRTTNDVDIQSVARNAALSFYKILCAKVPFDELMTTSPFFPLKPNRTQYNIGVDFPLEPQLRAISDIQINLGTTTAPNFRRLRRSHVRVFDALSIMQPSNPSTYARWGMQLIFNPPPQQNYPIQFRYWSKPVIVPGSLFYTTALISPEEWDELVKWETLFRVYYALDREQDALSLVQPPMTQMMPGSPRKQTMYQTGIIPRLWNDLLSTASQKENVDEDFNINPVIRPYSVRS